MRKAKWILGLMLVLSNTAFADGGAVCRKIYTQRLQMDCLAGIAERPVNEAGWLVCDKVYGDQPILDCMRVIMGKYISPEGARVCERMVSNKPMTDCLRTLAGHNLQPEAAQVCGKLVSNDPMTSCLAAALDAQYSPDEISSCDQQTYSNQPAIDNKPTTDACAQHCAEDDIVAFTGAFNRFGKRQTIGIIGRDDPALQSLSKFET